MLTGVFRDRTRIRASAAQSADDVLAILLRSKSLQPHRFTRNCEIGPFIVSCVCAERALVIDLSSDHSATDPRSAFLESLGYQILKISPRDVLARPEVVIAQVCNALK